MAKTIKGSLSGVWLMQTIKMSVPVPCKVQYTVRHKGDGNNKLRVRHGSFFHLVWAKTHDFDLEAGKSATRTTERKSDSTGSSYLNERPKSSVSADERKRQYWTSTG